MAPAVLAGESPAVAPSLASDGNGDGAALLGRATTIFQATFGAVTTFLVILVLGIYFAASPSVYYRALIRITPPAGRDRAGEIVNAVASALRSWLIGRTASMVAVTLLTAVGLLVLGVPLVLSLSLLTGLLNFVPLIGPITSAVPAVLLGWTEGGLGLALWVGLFYWGVQVLEGFAITPYIQRQMVSIPPALLLASQIVMGLAAGLIGVVFATPLAVVVVVLVQTLYAEEVLDEDVKVWGS